MSDFNFHNSKVKQVNEKGDNYKITGNSAPVAISEKGGVVQTHGDHNRTVVDNPKPGVWKTIFGKLKAACLWLFGKRTAD